MERNQVSVLNQTATANCVNQVLRNTYLLLSMTLLFSAFTAMMSMSMGMAMPRGLGGVVFLLAGTYGLLFLTMRLRNSPWGLVSIFGFTGFMGFMLGPVLNAFLTTFSNGGELIMTSLGTTGLTFLGLSAYALRTTKPMTGLGQFLTVGIMIAFITMIANLFLQLPAVHLALSGMFVLISSALILYRTSEVVNGGETNYIMATIDLYVALYNLFISLLNLLAAFSGQRD